MNGGNRKFKEIVLMGLLRLFLALFVVLGHTPGHNFVSRPLDDGLAVQCFFSISGFYMYFILSGCNGRRYQAIAFYKSRFLRIFPLYILCLFVTIVLVLLIPAEFTGYVMTRSFSEVGSVLSPVYILLYFLCSVL